MNSFEETLLKEKFEEYVLLLSELNRTGKSLFAKRYRSMFENAGFDVDDPDYVDDQLLFISYAIKSKKLFTIDWSGEEYPGQVKRCIKILLKQYDTDVFNWDRKKFESTLDWDELKRGDYLPLLFADMNKTLNTIGFKLFFLDTKSDCYNYTILPVNEYENFENADFGFFSLIDTNVYNIFLDEKGNDSGKMMLYLKKKFELPLAEIKQFYQQDNILLGKGDSSKAKEIQKEVESIGGKVRLEQIG